MPSRAKYPWEIKEKTLRKWRRQAAWMFRTPDLEELLYGKHKAKMVRRWRKKAAWSLRKPNLKKLLYGTYEDEEEDSFDIDDDWLVAGFADDVFDTGFIE